MNIRNLCLLIACTALLACGRAPPGDDAHDHGHGHDEEAGHGDERGPHGGRLLRDGEFAVEVTIFESGVEPRFRLYAYEDDKPVAPAALTATLRVERLGGKSTLFRFAAQQDYLQADATVAEPHSFQVTLDATHEGRTHAWHYDSFEGRVRIPAATASEAGVVVETAGPAKIRNVVSMVGTVVINPDRHAHLKARFPGTVRAVKAQLGDPVRGGQALLIIEANESMREYPVTAPFDGVVLARETNVGDVTGDHALIEIADLSEVWVELHALGEQSTRIARGQPVTIRSATTRQRAETRVSAVLPLATRGQSIIVRARLANTDGQWRPGMTVSAEVAVTERQVPLAVRENALQRWRDFTVVFGRVGEIYEPHVLELGARDGEFAEVLSGLDAGTEYVTEQSYLIKADIEKSAAGHDH